MSLFKIKAMKTNRLLLPLVVFALITASNTVTYAQDDEMPGEGPDRKEKVEQLKIAFFTKELNLSTSEAEKFWPVYHEFDAKLREEKKKQREIGEKMKEGHADLSDAELKKNMTAIFDSEIREAEIKKAYTEKIAAVIGYKKTAKLLSLERRFRQELVQRLHDHPAPPHKRGPGGGPNPHIEHE